MLRVTSQSRCASKTCEDMLDQASIQLMFSYSLSLLFSSCVFVTMETLKQAGAAFTLHMYKVKYSFHQANM